MGRNMTERDETERERNDKKEERERNDLAEGPRSRTKRNDFKKVGTCPALNVASLYFSRALPLSLSLRGVIGKILLNLCVRFA